MKSRRCSAWLSRLLAIVACGVYAGEIWAQTPQRTWSTGFSHDPDVNRPTVLSLATIQQERLHLIGTFVFENNLDNTANPKPVSIGGKTIGGEFKASVELQVADEREGKWETIASAVLEPVSVEILLGPGSFIWLHVELDPFQQFIGKRHFGKVRLKSGEEAIFPLEELAPPSP